MSGSGLVLGLHNAHVSLIRDALNEAALSKFDFIVIPLFHPRLRRDVSGTSSSREGPQTRSDRELESKDWQSNIVGFCSEWCDFDNPNATSSSRRAAEECLRQECSWASHLSLQAVVLPTPSLLAPNYARAIKQLCECSATFQHLWLKIPLTLELDYRNTPLGGGGGGGGGEGGGEGEGEVTDGWEIWDSFRHLVGHQPRLSVALVLSSNVPTNIDEVMSRWAAEPVKAVFIPTSLFVDNKKGFPVLPKIYQPILVALMRFQMHVILTGASKYSDQYTRYNAFLHHFKAQHDLPLDEGEAFTFGYKDRLQTPLQPLMDNLESLTYEVFERDPVKYVRYENAIRKALLDLVTRRSIDAAMSDDSSPTFVITVVGAGRGPLVVAALKAAAAASLPVRIYAVEKNENAIITLKNRVMYENWTNVTIVAGDMRKWQPPELADILVSELLGSWGDNELSPECLDGAQACLKRDDGISIPCDYTSFIAPLSTSKLWMGAREMMQGKGLDTPYVVKLHACHYLSPSQPLFRFEHPNWSLREPAENSRYASISFLMTSNATLHGLSGTFESTLYADETLSIMPQTHSPGMFSWFPLFIPLTTPLSVKMGDVVTFSVWRCVSVELQKVWYEWCLTSPVRTPIQNSGGHAFFVGL